MVGYTINDFNFLDDNALLHLFNIRMKPAPKIEKGDKCEHCGNPTGLYHEENCKKWAGAHKTQHDLMIRFLISKLRKFNA